MIDVLNDVIGRAYTPILSPVYSSDGSYIGDVVASGFAGLDVEYIASCAIFALSLYCLFRLLGGILRD